MDTQHRAYRRYPHRLPISYAPVESGHFHQAEVQNSSLGGMCFDAEQALFPACHIDIKMKRYHPGRRGPWAYQHYRAQVKWCNPITRTTRTLYGIGVAYLRKSHVAYGVNMGLSARSCTLCGLEALPADKLNPLEKELLLCLECYQLFHNIPNDYMQHTIKQYLLGNII